jgi:signal transduction histidine kinase
MAQSLQELDQLKSDFVSHVSHELRTPLTSAKLSLANLQDDVLGPITPKQREVVARIRQDMDRLIHMVNELLDLARLEAGKVEIHRETIDLGSVTSQAVETIRPLASQKGVALSIEGAISVQGDRGKLLQVILNLLDNAVKFTPSGGSVCVAMKGQELIVEDSGPGLTTDPEKIFEKFARREQPGAPGAGIGLSITRKLVELHGATICATNRSEGGARFSVQFK